MGRKQYFIPGPRALSLQAPPSAVMDVLAPPSALPKTRLHSERWTQPILSLASLLFRLIMQSCLSAKMGGIKIGCMLNLSQEILKRNPRTSTLSPFPVRRPTGRYVTKDVAVVVPTGPPQTKTKQEYIDYREGLWDHGEISSRDVSSYSPLFIIDELQ